MQSQCWRVKGRRVGVGLSGWVTLSAVSCMETLSPKVEVVEENTQDQPAASTRALMGD